jgi:hypothetical protein
LRSCRFCGTTGYGKGGIPSDDDTWAGGGFGFSKGGGSGGFGAAKAASGNITHKMAEEVFMAGTSWRSARKNESPKISQPSIGIILKKSVKQSLDF